MTDVDRTPDAPSAEDPYVRGSTPDSDGVEPDLPSPREREAIAQAANDPKGENGPSYERHQDPEDTTGGSTDPHNTLGHADSGNES